MRSRLTSIICMACIGLVDACTPDPVESGADTIIDGIVRPNVGTRTWATHVDNPYFPLRVGARWHYGANTPDGFETRDVEVLDETRVVNGVAATVVHSVVRVEGDTLEEAWRWYAQDIDGNVWHLGKDACVWEAGVCVKTDGAWEWGVDEALPGYVMRTRPKVDGRPYFQVYYIDEVEDVSEVIRAHESIHVTAGDFRGCIRTRDTSNIDPSLDEERVFCPGVGNVFVAEPEFDVHLIKSTGL